MSQQEHNQSVQKPLPKMRVLSSDDLLSIAQTKTLAESLVSKLTQVMDMVGSDLPSDTIGHLGYDLREFAGKMASYQFMTNRDCTDLENELAEAMHYVDKQISDLQDIRPSSTYVGEYSSSVATVGFRVERLVVALSRASVIAHTLPPRTVSRMASIAVTLEFVPRVIQTWRGSIPGGLSPEQNDKLNESLNLLAEDIERVRNLNTQLLKHALPSNTPDGKVIA